MFKRSFKGDRVEKVGRLKKSLRDQAKLEKLKKSFEQSAPVEA